MIDWTKPVEPQDKELYELIADKFKGGEVIGDKLFKVHLTSGEEKLLFIHIEVQSSNELNFQERMFVYFYRIFDSHGRLLTAMALYTSDSLPDNYDRFEYDVLGTKVTYQFNTYCIKHAKEEELLASSNPFALAVLAAKYVNKSKKKNKLRYEYKMKLIELCRERKYSDMQIEALLKFIHLLVVLPAKTEKQFESEVIKKYSIKSKDMDAASQEKIARFGRKLHIAFYGETPEETLARGRKEAEKEFAEQLAREKKAAAKEFAEQLAREKKEVAEQLAREKKEAAEQLAREKKEAAEELLKISTLSVEQIAKTLGLTKQEVLDIQTKINQK